MKISMVCLKKIDDKYYKLMLEKNYKLIALMYTKTQLAKIINDPNTYPQVREYIIQKFDDGSID